MRILVFGGQGESTKAVINALSKRYEDVFVILENKISRSLFIKRRIKRLGLITVIGQIAFSLLVLRRLKRKSQGRVSEIIQRYNLDLQDSFTTSGKCFFVESINDSKVIDLYNSINPDIIIVNGTRIISKTILDSVKVPIINMHVGITPKYRGVHGGYWAMANNDSENCGVTIHFVNLGVDTGDVIKQKRISVTSEDNFVTYPYIQTGEGIRLELEILEDFDKNGIIPTTKVDLPSHIWSHPTLWQYIKNYRKSR